MNAKSIVLVGWVLGALGLAGCAASTQTAGQISGLDWSVWVVIIVLLCLLLFTWWVGSRTETESTPPVSAAIPARPAAAPAPPPAAPITPAAYSAPVAAPAAPIAAAAPVFAAAPVPATPDDLKRIEGIGPKISSLLNAAGIATFRQLAITDVARLRQILADANLSRLADPETWPDQAALAAAGDWAGLETLQSQLKGGKRVR